jgi:hypothetical protein
MTDSATKTHAPSQAATHSAATIDEAITSLNGHTVMLV